MTIEKTPQKGRTLQVELPIKFINYENYEPKYANTIVLTASQAEEFQLTFGTVAVPPFLRDDEWRAVKSIDAYTIARILLSRRHLAELMDLLIGAYNNSVGSTVYRKEEQAP